MSAHECVQSVTLDGINETLSKLDHDVHRVSVKNGGGRMIEMERNDFDQMIYDKTKDMTLGEAVEKGSQFSGKLMMIFSLIQTIIFVIVAVWKK
jgi:hypothetical protein